MDAHRIVRDIDRTLPAVPYARAGGSLLIMVGLPGTGKSMIMENLHAILPCVIISTDAVRQYIRRYPTYTAAEMMFVYEVCHRVIEQRLARGQRVAFDGTNHMAARRQQLFKLAERRTAPVAVCHVQAAEHIIRERLSQRKSGSRREGDLSDAGWSVYQWMVAAQEPIVEPHIMLDTTETPPVELARRLANYWLACEGTA
ncbi:MAG: ATP-binding protein [Chloroflexi bacterium]|nr:ATP-binding protein [Chloroflexota bacterium]MCI0577888.1 ATP-binding protein [Chloroflexota bacterium]MCI0644476.1 ATP-binding protein [Chloroflexota bacterium]MCI0730256.1 ATP-binding protein [Chloroflexota bacterium]